MTNNNSTTNNNGFSSPNTEDFSETALVGSMQHILQDNIGAYVGIEFLIGTNTTQTRQGVLYDVGRNYVVLYDVGNRNYIIGDIFSIKFVTFYSPDGIVAYTNMGSLDLDLDVNQNADQVAPARPQPRTRGTYVRQQR